MSRRTKELLEASKRWVVAINLLDDKERQRAYDLFIRAEVRNGFRHRWGQAIMRANHYISIYAKEGKPQS